MEQSCTDTPLRYLEEVDNKCNEQIPWWRCVFGCFPKSKAAKKVALETEQLVKVVDTISGYLDATEEALKGCDPACEAHDDPAFKKSAVVFKDVNLTPSVSIIQSKLLNSLGATCDTIIDLDQVNTFENEIFQCINHDRLGTPPNILILTRLPTDVEQVKGNQLFEKVQVTKHSRILKIPYEKEKVLVYTDIFTKDVAKEIAMELHAHDREGILVVYSLGQRCLVTWINSENSTVHSFCDCWNRYGTEQNFSQAAAKKMEKEPKVVKRLKH
ncbi:sucrose synthase [Ranunculus cassubicifolius]